MSKRVLVVDQSRTIQILLSQYFGNAGCLVISCSTQDEALQVLGSVGEVPDLIVLTIDARKEAYKVVAYVKGREAYARTHLVAMVLEEERVGIQKTLNGLNISYLVKPFRLQDIQKLVSITFNASF